MVDYNLVPGMDENGNLPPELRAALIASAEFTAALNSKVSPLVSAALAKDPTISAAGLKAVQDAASGLSLITQSALDSAVSKLAMDRTLLATYGDSMTAYAQGGYAPWGALVADYLGLSLFNPSTPGERTSDIALRQGGFAPRFTVPGGVIPADTTEFAVTIQETRTSGFNPGATKGNIGTFNNVSFLGIPVNLYHLKVNNVETWTMQRITAVPAPTPVPSIGGVVRDIASAAYRKAIQIFMGGFNGGDQVADVALMKAHLANPKGFILLSMALGASGGDPTGYSNEIARWGAAYPDNYFDISHYVIQNGLFDENITPTDQDKADMAAGITPVSLRRSIGDPHYNAAGHRVIARRVAELLIERGFVPASSDYRIPARPAPLTGLVLSLPQVDSVASLPAPSSLTASESVSVRLINMTIPTLTDTNNYRSLASQWGSAGSGTSAWQFLLDNQGRLFAQDVNGGFYAPGTVPVIAPVNNKISLRMDIDRLAGTAQFYTSTNGGATWTSYAGGQITGRSTTNSIAGKTQPLRVGGNGYNAILGSKLERLTILDKTGATLFDNDFTVRDTKGWTYQGSAALVAA